jgi:hypothetical protein
MAMIEKAAGQGHAYAMNALASIHDTRNEPEQNAEWLTKAKAYTRSRFRST